MSRRDLFDPKPDPPLVLPVDLRDYFAAMALRNSNIYIVSDNPLYFANVAQGAYLLADAMLAERAKP